MRIEQLDGKFSQKLSQNENLSAFVDFLEGLSIRNSYFWAKNRYNFRSFNGDENLRIFKYIDFSYIFPAMTDASL